MWAVLLEKLLIWSVISGCFFVLALPAVYQTFVAASRPLALILAAAIGFMGYVTVFLLDYSVWIRTNPHGICQLGSHNIGSGIRLCWFPTLSLNCFLIYRTMGNTQFSQLFWG